MPNGYQKYLGIPTPFKFLWFWSSQHRKQPLTLTGSAGGRRLHTIFVKEKKFWRSIVSTNQGNSLSHCTVYCLLCRSGKRKAFVVGKSVESSLALQCFQRLYRLDSKRCKTYRVASVTTSVTKSSKRWFYTYKPDLNVLFYDFWYTNSNNLQTWFSS